MSHSFASLSSFGEFLITDSGIVSVISLIATVILGGIALWIARRYQTDNTAAAERNHNELVQRVVVLAEILARDSAVEASAAAGTAGVEASLVGPESPVLSGNEWRSGGFLAADVTGSGKLDLITQQRSKTGTTLRLFRIDERLRPSLLATLSASHDRRFAVGPGSPAPIATRTADGEVVAYRWLKGKIDKVAASKDLEPPHALTEWPS